MANFWDLPKDVRKKIYRLHLVREDPVTLEEHADATDFCDYSTSSHRRMPHICFVSHKAEKEATPVYYGENHFDLASAAASFGWQTYTRHMRLIRRLTCTWPKINAHDAFLAVARMKRLEELCIRVDEVSMVEDRLKDRHFRQDWKCSDPTPQQQLAILRHPGMTGLLTIQGVPHVEFIKSHNWRGDEVGGPIPGGILETQIKPKLMSPKAAKAHAIVESGSLIFLSLPAEIRNRIYGLVLEINGPVHPSRKAPSSATRGKTVQDKISHVLKSSLNLLAVNRQIHDEAVGIFYHANHLEFYYPAQLHAFLLSLSPLRQSFIRNITLHYYNNKSGGIDLIDLTLPLLKQLTGLRRFHLLFNKDLTNRLYSTRYLSASPYNVLKANPTTLPGVKFLFTLRGVTDIKLRDTALDSALEDIRERERKPDFTQNLKDRWYIKLERIFEHLNAALVDAQAGRVNRKLLDDDEWHLKEVFPHLDDD